MSQAKEIPVAERIDHKLEELEDQIHGHANAFHTATVVGSLAAGKAINSIMKHDAKGAGIWGALAIGGFAYSLVAFKDMAISRNEYQEFDMERLNHPEYARRDS